MNYIVMVEILETAYGETVTKKTTICDWYKRFEEGCEDVGS